MRPHFIGVCNSLEPAMRIDWMRKSVAAWKAVGLVAVSMFGFGLVVHAADGTITFPGFKFAGPFSHTANPSTEGVYGKFYGGSLTAFNIIAYLPVGNHGSAKIQIWDSPANLAKAPKTYTFKSSQGHPAPA